MPTVRASITVPGRAAIAERIWYEPSLWASWIEDFAHLASLGDTWPERGAQRVWDSRAGGRGRVREEVAAYEVRTGMTLEWEDAELEGTSKVAFEPRPEDVNITLEITYAVKHRDARSRLVELVMRRRQGDIARRTLRRFASELAAERQFGSAR